MYHQYWKSPFGKDVFWSPASWSPSINGWGFPLVLVNDEMRIYIHQGLRKTTRKLEPLCWAWERYHTSWCFPQNMYQIMSDSCCKDRWIFFVQSTNWFGDILRSGFENPSNNRFSEAGGSFSLAGSHSLATPRKILKDDHSDPPKAHCFIEKTRETTAQVFSHMTSMRQQRWSLEHQGVLDGLLRNHVLWWKWREQHPVCQSLHF